MKSVLCIIPARSGSKGIPDKNVSIVGSKPLIHWTISTAKKSKMINHIMASTDSHSYAEIFKKHNIDTPFLRPKSLAKDTSTSEDVVIHSLKWLEKNRNFFPDYIIYLQPTSPLRISSDIDTAIKIGIENDADSVVSVNEVSQHPYYMKKILKDGQIKHFQEIISPAPRRQDLEKLYVLNGAIFLVKKKNNFKFKMVW